MAPVVGMRTTGIPPTSAEKASEAAALAFVNEIRSDYGAPTLAELQPGRPADANRCTLACSLPAKPDEYWSVTRWSAVLFAKDGAEQRDKRGLPPSVGWFVALYDAELFPHLLAKGAPDA